MNQDLSDQLGTMLRSRADHLAPSSVTFDSVRGNAVRIRRRRATVAGVAASLTLIGVPAAVLSLTGGEPEPGPVAVAPPTYVDSGNERLPSQEQLPIDRSELGLPALEPAALPRGDDATVPWAQGRTLHLDGGQVTLASNVARLLPFDDGWLVVEQTEEGRATRIIDAQGATVAEPQISPDLGEVSANGRYTSYVERSSLVVRDNTTGTARAVVEPESSNAELIGVDDDGKVYFNVGDQPGWTTDGRVWADGEVTDPSPGAERRITVVSPLGYTVQTLQLDDFGGCFGVFDTAGDEQARTCTHNPEAFSPDGRSLAMGPNYGDGLADLNLAIAGENLSQPLHEWVNYTDAGDAQPGFTGFVWEDDEHLLTPMLDTSRGYENATWYLVRIGLDGTAELAADPITAGQDAGIRLAGE